MWLLIEFAKLSNHRTFFTDNRLFKDNLQSEEI